MELKKQPLVVSYGMGVDSTAVLVGLVNRGIRPDMILFADTGAEKEETYAYLDVINTYLEAHGFPQVTVVKNVPTRFKNWPPYYSLEENCLTNGTLPSISFGFSSCSQKWKQAPQHKLIKSWQPARDAWLQGKKVTKLIGYDCSARDKERGAKAEKMVVTYKDKLSKYYDYLFPLQVWGWDRDECKRQISAAGLPIPEKSSCFFCIAMKPDEVRALPLDKLRRIVLMEARAKPRLTKVEGLWRSSTKKTNKPGSMTEFIRREGLLPESEIHAIQNVPDVLISFQKDFAAGLTNQPLGRFLQENFQTMYCSGNTPVLQMPAVKQPTLFDLEEAA